MKKFKYFFMFIAALMISFAATSCGTDEYDDEDLDDEDLFLMLNSGKQTATLNESADQLVLTIKHEKVQTMIYTAKFINGLCTSYTIKIECGSKALADRYERTATIPQMAPYFSSRNGNTIIMDISKDYKDTTYEDVKEEFEAMKAVVDNGDLWQSF